MGNKYKNPVVPLVLALYGHPDAGGFWEEQCDAAVKSCGFQDFKDSGWRSTYWHPKEKALLVVYVDDFNLSAPAKAHDRLWKQLRAQLNLEEPSDPNRFLGCYKRAFAAKAKDLEKILQHKPELYPRAEAEKREAARPKPLKSLDDYEPDTNVKGYVYDMDEYVGKNVARYRKETGAKKKLKKVATPFSR